MIVILKQNAPQQKVDELYELIRSKGLDIHTVEGE